MFHHGEDTMHTVDMMHQMHFLLGIIKTYKSKNKNEILQIIDLIIIAITKTQ